MRANKCGDAPQCRFGVEAVTAEAGCSFTSFDFESPGARQFGTSKPVAVSGLQKKSPPSCESGPLGSDRLRDYRLFRRYSFLRN